MARPLRIDMPNGLSHVTSRGLERPVIAHEDRERGLELLDRERRLAARMGRYVEQMSNVKT